MEGICLKKDELLALKEEIKRELKEELQNESSLSVTTETKVESESCNCAQPKPFKLSKDPFFRGFVWLAFCFLVIGLFSIGFGEDHQRSHSYHCDYTQQQPMPDVIYVR
jgi:hypothetical protein